MAIARQPGSNGPIIDNSTPVTWLYAAHRRLKQRLEKNCHRAG
jgi:hypothetical protein